MTSAKAFTLLPVLFVLIVSAAGAQQVIRVDDHKLSAVSPALERYGDHDLFGGVWKADELSMRDRSLVTVAALVAAGHVDQIGYHLNRAMDHGLTKGQASALLSHLAFSSGWPNAFSALSVFRDVFANRKE